MEAGHKKLLLKYQRLGCGGVFIPSAILILLAVVRLCTDTRCRRTTIRCARKNWIPDLGHRDDRFLVQHDVCVCRTGGRPDDCRAYP